jgi:hypothetical protein
MDGDSRRHRLPADDVRIAVVATAAVLVLVVGAGIVAATTSWSPVSDWALLELQVRAVGGAHTPLTGVYSRFGWSHPGPWPIWLLAVPYRLVGSSSIGLLLGAVALKGVVVVGMARVAWRRGSLVLTLLTLIAVCVLLRSVGVGLLLDPWNPWLAAPALAWFTFLAWDLAAGHRWSLPVAVAVGSLAVQAHHGVAVVVAVVGATAVLLVALGAGRALEAEDGPPWGRVVLVAVVVGAVLWAPAAVDELTHDPGNAREVVSFFFGRGSDGATTFFGDPAEPTGWHDGLSVLSCETVGWAPWLGGPEPRTILGSVDGRSPLLLAAPVLLLLVTGVVGRRRRRPELWTGAVLGTAVMVAAALSLARVLGQPFDYLVRWVWPLALFVHVLAAWAVVVEVRERRAVTAPAHAVPTWLAWTAVVGLLAASTMTLVAGAGARGPRSGDASTVEALVPPALTWVREHGDGPVLVESEGGLTTIPPALVLALDRAHREVVVDGGLAAGLPDYRHREVDPATTLVIAGPTAAARLDHQPGVIRLADDPGDPRSDARPALALFAVTS